MMRAVFMLLSALALCTLVAAAHPEGAEGQWLDNADGNCTHISEETWETLVVNFTTGEGEITITKQERKWNDDVNCDLDDPDGEEPNRKFILAVTYNAQLSPAPTDGTVESDVWYNMTITYTGLEGTVNSSKYAMGLNINCPCDGTWVIGEFRSVDPQTCPDDCNSFGATTYGRMKLLNLDDYETQELTWTEFSSDQDTAWAETNITHRYYRSSATYHEDCDPDDEDCDDYVTNLLGASKLHIGSSSLFVILLFAIFL